MGSSASKPASPHVWAGSGPPTISQDMLQQLQSSTETDVTRAQTLELHVQARVAEELRRIQAEKLDKLKAAEQAIADQKAAAAAEAAQSDEGLSSAAVSKEIAALRTRLEERQREVSRPLPASVESARGDVVRCLREHDRRPLDCWREVAAFKEEVRKLEASWVDRVTS